MASAKDDSGIYHLTVGTEVSAKYRGAFCEARIKSLKKGLVFKVISKKTGKSLQLSEDQIKGVLKIGATVEVQLPDQTSWQECTIQSVRDRSSYTVIFDDGDERTLSRSSLCLKGDRHYAKSETLDNLPLTDPENFGTPVLGCKKNRRRRPADEEYEDESEDHKTLDRETLKTKEKRQLMVQEAETSSEDDEDDDEKRTRWLADALMGKVVIVEPNDKRKHWFPGLVVNPLCHERHKDLSTGFLVVRSFKTGKFSRVSRESVKELSNATVPPKLDSSWKDILEDAQQWQKTRTVPDRWRMDIKDILDDSEDDDDDANDKSDDDSKKKGKEDKSFNSESEDSAEKELKKKHDFLEVLYKFMDDCGTPINKTPVLGYKDLNLHLLFTLVQKRQGSFSFSSIKEWKQIYLDLGIPKPNPAAGHNVRTAYGKYLGAYEEYCSSWKNVPLLKKSTSIKTSPGNKDKKRMKIEKNSKASQDGRKIKAKESAKVPDSTVESKMKGRSSPLLGIPSIDSTVQPRRSYQRRRVSESSSASDATLPPNGKTDKKKPAKGSQLKRGDEKFRSPGGPDSEPDEKLRLTKPEKKETADKRHAPKSSAECASAKRIRRNSTSSVSTQYSIGDKLKVKYGQGKNFKLYDAKVLQVKPPEGPGETTEYLVHYAGWNARHDEWIRPVRIVGFAEEKGSVPVSPAAGTTKLSARRPRTPMPARTTCTLKDEIIPSPGSSYPISSRFSDVDDFPDVKDDLPDLTIKPRVSSLLKKNLVGDFMKSLSSSTTSSTKRSTSPVLVGSQRMKRSKTPPTPLESPVAPASMEPEPSLDAQVNQEPPSTIVMESASAETQEKTIEKEVTKDEETVIAEEKPTQTLPEIEMKPDTKQSESKQQERSESPSEKSLSPIGETGGENANEQRAETPLQHIRRTSRRSKSPAYLIDSTAWYPTKRKKYGSASVEKSPSPSPTSDKNENLPKQESDSAAISVSTQGTSPPTFPSQSSNSPLPTPEIKSPSKEMSPVLSNLPKVTKTRMQSRKKLQEKQESASDQPEEKSTPDDEKQKLEAATEATEYDNFDDEAPSIALEKHHETENSMLKSPDEIAEEHSEDSKSHPISDTNEHTQQVSSASPEPEKSVKKKTETTEKTSGRKIRKKKVTTGDAEIIREKTDEQKVVDAPEATEDDGGAAHILPSDTIDLVSREDTEENTEPVKTSEPQEASNKNESSENVNTSETISSSNHDNAGESSHNLLPPQNPPSSKVLMENTPPTTPEQSPNYISEDQDIDGEKSSPNLFNDAMDIAEEEHKDSNGNTSSSGCEQAIPLGKGNQQQENADGQDEKEELSSSSGKKKRRDVPRKGSASKNMGGRRSSYASIQESESEDDQDNEAGETDRRKRRESGGRGKPRKKRTKVRPEPPSAPPPLPQEELESMSQDDRIAVLQSRMAEMRKVYHQLKQEVANIDRKRKRAKRREKEAAEAAQLSKIASSPFSTRKFAYPASTSKAEGMVAPPASDLAENLESADTV